MDSSEPPTYSYGPFLPGKLPDSLERAELQTILRSNGRCTPSDALNYGRQIAPTLAKVAEYDVEIAKLQAILTRMGGDRSVLQYHADACDSVSAPIRRLPNEMLLEIFDSCSPLQHPTYYDDWKEYHNEEPSSKIQRPTPRYRYLLQLAQVCASWHGLIMGLPALWAKIEVDFTSLISQTNSKPILAAEILAISRVFLERSGIAPLEIHFRGHDFGHVPYGSVLGLMARQSNRWTHVQIWPHYNSKTVDNFAVLASIRGNLRLLRSLHISNLPDDCNFFEMAPRLTELTLEEPIAPHPKLPWGQIHTLSYAQLFSDELGTALSHLSCCPQLVKLAILRLYVSDRDELVVLPSVVSDVQSFAFGFNLESYSASREQSTTVTGLLGCLTLRRAHTLRFKTVEEAPLFWHHIAFLALCARSSLHDTLRILEIPNLMISAAQLLECLSGLPRLGMLSISDPNHCPGSFRLSITEDNNLDKFLVNDILLRGLTLTPDSEVLVPHLHTFDCKTFMQFEDSSYLDFIASRVGPGRNATGPFQSSILYFCDVQVNSTLAQGLAGFILRQELRSRLECDFLNRHWPGEPSHQTNM
ncbi:hypothetical protein B0H16DRAFT_1459273 [Mycena metata]|uniref:F-box domain-containing protein n=1 Tax=Mycena metata TaxID=1033252 RepID=A0AAD7J3T6_9AGAR|nr:hypothetical protein B0H16DRAFT_1459273 [Mycena metata]